MAPGQRRSTRNSLIRSSTDRSQVRADRHYSVGLRSGSIFHVFNRRLQRVVSALIRVLVPARLRNTVVFLRCRMIVKRSIIDAPFGGAKPQEILCSNDYSTPKSYNQYYRATCCPEDPWLSYHDHGTSSMMYGEAGRYAILIKAWTIFFPFLIYLRAVFIQVTLGTLKMC